MRLKRVLILALPEIMDKKDRAPLIFQCALSPMKRRAELFSKKFDVLCLREKDCILITDVESEKKCLMRITRSAEGSGTIEDSGTVIIHGVGDGAVEQRWIYYFAVDRNQCIAAEMKWIAAIRSHVFLSLDLRALYVTVFRTSPDEEELWEDRKQQWRI